MAQAKTLGMMGDFAVAEAAKLCNPDVIAAYPITPQTIIVERLSEFVADGELDCEYICVESEHSAMSACFGASAAGARVFTATASQGLALMIEIVYITASARFPIVMAIADRALSGPINIHCDHSDAMLARDSGWIQLFAEDCQEAYDTTVQSFRIAEDKRVSLPIMPCLDGFVLTHSIEPVTTLPLEDEETLDGFLPIRDPLYKLDIEAPIAQGLLALPDFYMEIKRGQQEAHLKSIDVIKEVIQEFGERWGRYYPVVEPYRMDDAEVAVVTIGSATGTGRVAVDTLREEGKKVGLVKLRCFRPFPDKDIQLALKNAQAVGVCDRAVSFGSTGPAYADTAGALYGRGGPLLKNFIIGLGGKDITVDTFRAMYDKLYTDLSKGEVEERTEWIGIRE
ncbi:MAG: transketolase C-terminal domain-containing protein [Promethearchaeota archaeon]